MAGLDSAKQDVGGGAGAARLLLRGVVGVAMLAHGIRHARTIEGTARWFDGLGFRQPELQARASAAVEIGSGVALLAGAGTPLAASAVVGTMAVAARSVHLSNGYFVLNEGYEYVLALSAAAGAAAALGPGRVSVDRLVGADRFAGARVAAFAVATGLAAAAAQLAAFWRPKPVASS